MKVRSHIFGAVLAIVACCVGARAQMTAVGDGGPGPVKAQHLTAELVSLGPVIAPGGQQEIGLLLTMEEKWHVYWLNAGDSGEPPHVRWTLPAGITAGPLAFPIPERLPLGPLMDFGYEDIVAFPITVAAAADLKPGPVHLDAMVDWLVCAQVCIPGKAHLGIDLTVQPGAPGIAQEPRVGALGESMGLIPGPLPAGASFRVSGDAKSFVLTLRDGHREANAEFYPYLDPKGGADAAGPIANASDQKIEPLDDGVRLHVVRSPDVPTLPGTLAGVFKLSDAVAYEVSAPVGTGDAGEPVSSGAGAPAGASGPGGVTALGAIGLAFLGGVILNLMPCVFPVLFLKGLGLLQASGQERAHVRRHGLVYTLGILVSFWAIVAVLLVVRAGGSHAGWGFQLQSPAFLAVLASGIFFFALSLAGLFDIGLSLTSAGGELAQKQGYAGSFFTGVLATVVATPCTAPLMGAAIGFALAQSAGVTFAVFTALALGLAAPYLVLSFEPRWTRILPRPGAWMEVFKQITAAIFFATTIWLAWVYGQLYAPELGVNEVALLLGCFLVLAIAGWVLGRWPARWGSGIAAVVLIALALAIPLSQVKDAGQTAVPATAAAASGSAAGGAAGSTAAGAGLVWAPYSQAALDAAQSAGHPVFIDFTAAWCLSCQVNERLVLRSSEVMHALQAGHVALLKGDWTNEDPEITKKLAEVKRGGVPTYVMYSATVGASADVLPELLSKDVVLKAIERDAK